MDLVPAKSNTHLWERSQRNSKTEVIDERYCEVDYVAKGNFATDYKYKGLVACEVKLYWKSDSTFRL